MSTWRNELETWLKTIDVDGSVLDVGGAQKPVKGRTRSWNVSDYEIWDLPQYNINIPNVAVGTERLKTFDNVFCLETLMYSNNPVVTILNLKGSTKKNLYISNPLEGYPETKPAGTDMCRLMPQWYYDWLNDEFTIIDKIIYPTDNWSDRAIRSEGYKAYRKHASGILIHAVRK